MARAEDLDRLYETVKKQKGRVDILFASSYITGIELFVDGGVAQI